MPMPMPMPMHRKSTVAEQARLARAAFDASGAESDRLRWQQLESAAAAAAVANRSRKDAAAARLQWEAVGASVADDGPIALRWMPRM